MKCKKCGKEIICTGLKVPRKCDECGTEFEMDINFCISSRNSYCS